MIFKINIFKNYIIHILIYSCIMNKIVFQNNFEKN